MGKEAAETSTAAAVEVAVAEASPDKPPSVPSTTVEELPKAIVRRVVKDRLSQLSSSPSRQKGSNSKSKSKEEEGEGGDEYSVHKDAILAFSDSTRIFIHYLSATANDICKESKRQTINADDVLKALEEIDFPEFIEPLKASLDVFRAKNGAKRPAAKSKEKGSDKKQKLEEVPAENGKDDGEEYLEKEEEEGNEEDNVEDNE